MPGCVLSAIADGLQEMGLSKSDTTVDEERVVGLAGFLGYGQRCRMGESIVWTHDEAVEGVVGTEDHLLVEIWLGEDSVRDGILGSLASLRLTDELDSEKSTGHRLGGFRELLHTTTLEILETNLFLDDQGEGSLGEFAHFNLVEPMATHLRIVALEIGENFLHDSRFNHVVHIPLPLSAKVAFESPNPTTDSMKATHENTMYGAGSSTTHLDEVKLASSSCCS